MGYRVKSSQGTQFRQWATKRIHEYIVKGFTMDDDRLKQEGARSRYFEELLQATTHKKFLSVRQEGRRAIKRMLDFYNLDIIISVGYRVKSQLATQFRIWATQRLKEYIVKGFSLNDERFKTGNSMNYFNELQERLREIRFSERFFIRKLRIFTQPKGVEKYSLFLSVYANILIG